MTSMTFSGVFIVYFEYISGLFPLFLLLTLNKKTFAGKMFLRNSEKTKQKNSVRKTVTNYKL